ncbi:MAG: hypothetical protein HY289_01775 [Planctomycetes bacterium]|nr:hypothetical protein [Planctomycetota bacterium]
MLKKSKYTWRWVLVLIGGMAWVSLGCSPQTLSMFLMPFADTSIDPEYKLFKADKEINLAIVSRFVRLDTHPDALGADVELAEHVAEKLRERCKENKHRLKIIPAAQVRSQEAKLRQLTGDASAAEIGRSLKADFVLDLSVRSFSLYEDISNWKMFRGRANLAINLHKLDGKDGEQNVFNKAFLRVHPRDSGPFDAGNLNPLTYRTEFLKIVANDISKMLIAYPPNEKRTLE